MSALVLVFDRASPAEWLAPTSQVLSAVAACDAKRTRADRQACKQQLVAHHRTAASAPLQLAKR